jgi:nucleotide-binding universal stress UspA family protein
MDKQVVLVPLDGSVRAEAALPYAERLARVNGAEVRLLAVIEKAPPGLAVKGYLERLARETLELHLDSTARRLTERGVKVSTSLVMGDPAEEILAAAEAADAGLIVMATHGRGGFDRWFIGSVADQVMRAGARPTLVVRPAWEGVSPATVEIRNILVPLDGSRFAEQALDSAVALARDLGASLTIARAEPLTSLMFGLERTPAGAENIEDAWLADVKAYLKRVREGLPADVVVETFALVGATAPALAQLAEERGIDLVVMSSHGRGGFRRLVLGSTADRLIRSGLPTMLVRAAPSAPVEVGEKARHCANCGRAITFTVLPDDRCPRCQVHLHGCPNCALWDGFGCLLQREEALNLLWRGQGCPEFDFRETPVPEGTGHTADRPPTPAATSP